MNAYNKNPCWVMIFSTHTDPLIHRLQNKYTRYIVDLELIFRNNIGF